MAKITALGFIMPVRDIDKALRFYCDAFGLKEVFRNEMIAFAGIPGTDSAVGLLRDDGAGQGPRHIGFHADHGLDREELLKAVESAGGRIVERGEHAPGVPFAIVADPDGNVFEV